MTGFLLLLVTGIWLAIDSWLSINITRKLTNATWRIPVAALIFAVLLPLPLIDEIVGGRQFEQLCRENSTIQVDRATAVGRTVYLAQADDLDIKGTWVRVVLQPRRFVDATTGETVISFNDLIAAGGLFIRTLGISEGSAPLIFKRWCQAADQYALDKLFKELGISLIRRP